MFAVASHVSDSCRRMGSTGRPHFLYLGRGSPGTGPIFCYCPAATVTDMTRTGIRHNIRPKAMWRSHTLCFCACRPVTQCDVRKLLLYTLWTSDVIHRVVKATVVVCPKDDVTALSLILVFRKNVFCGLWDTRQRGRRKDSSACSVCRFYYLGFLRQCFFIF